MSQDFFDATKVPPSQGVGGHPPGRFPFQITNSYAKENSAKTGAMLVVELTSDVGRIENRYNILPIRGASAHDNRQLFQAEVWLIRRGAGEV